MPSAPRMLRPSDPRGEAAVTREKSPAPPARTMLSTVIPERSRPVRRFPESGLFIEEPAISPDNRYLVYCRSNGGSSLWLLKMGTARPGSN